MWIIANWKSNKTISEALDWVSQVGPNIAKKGNVKVAVCPTFTDIEEVKKAIVVGNYPILVGAQDLSPFTDGPFTGEESARILADLVDLAILGHFERRKNFSETDQMVAEKVKRAREYNIIPLVCLQNTETMVPEEISLAVYEPVFAIGTGKPDLPDNANQVIEKIKEKNTNLEVLYGGSVTSQNAKAFLQQPQISGLLIGEASLQASEFLEIIKIAYALA